MGQFVTKLNPGLQVGTCYCNESGSKVPVVTVRDFLMKWGVTDCEGMDTLGYRHVLDFDPSVSHSGGGRLLNRNGDHRMLTLMQCVPDNVPGGYSQSSERIVLWIAVVAQVAKMVLRTESY